MPKTRKSGPSQRAKVEAVKRRIREEPSFALRVFKTIWAAQQEDEKFTLHHRGHDGKGFRESETFTLNRFYEEIEAVGFRMTPEQMEFLQERTQPYAAQYLRLGEEATEERREELSGAPQGRPKTSKTSARQWRQWSKEEREAALARINAMPD